MSGDSRPAMHGVVASLNVCSVLLPPLEVARGDFDERLEQMLSALVDQRPRPLQAREPQNRPAVMLCCEIHIFADVHLAVSLSLHDRQLESLLVLHLHGLEDVLVSIRRNATYTRHHRDLKLGGLRQPSRLTKPSVAVDRSGHGLLAVRRSHRNADRRWFISSGPRATRHIVPWSHNARRRPVQSREFVVGHHELHHPQQILLVRRVAHLRKPILLSSDGTATSPPLRLSTSHASTERSSFDCQRGS